jgi:hypothetical protein
MASRQFGEQTNERKRPMTKKNSSVALIPEYVAPADPSWDRARELCGKVRQSIGDIVALGLELKGLRDQWFAKGAGGGGDRMSQAYKNHLAAGCGEVVDRPTHGQVRGWQARVQEELGISDDTARRLIDKARYCSMLKTLSEGEAIEYRDTTQEIKQIHPTEETKARAEAALDDVASGAVAAPRAFAGVVGESHRRNKSGGAANRAEVDHAQNLKDGLRKLKNSLRHWRKLEPGQRAEIECLWGEVRRLLPDTWAE